MNTAPNPVYLTSYDALVCRACAPTFRSSTLTPVDLDVLRETYGSQPSRCEGCGKLVPTPAGVPGGVL